MAHGSRRERERQETESKPRRDDSVALMQEPPRPDKGDADRPSRNSAIRISLLVGGGFAPRSPEAPDEHAEKASTDESLPQRTARLSAPGISAGAPKEARVDDPLPVSSSLGRALGPTGRNGRRRPFPKPGRPGEAGRSEAFSRSREGSTGRGGEPLQEAMRARWRWHVRRSTCAEELHTDAVQEGCAGDREAAALT